MSIVSPHQLSASELYATAMTLPDMGREERKVAHNTYVRHEATFAIVRYHSTDIAIINQNGSVTVNSGGWETATTKIRLNALLPGRVNICQEKYRWYYWKLVDGKTVKVPFLSYTTVRTDGTVWFGSERIL